MNAKERALVLDPRPITEPVPLNNCIGGKIGPDKKPVDCGVCWPCLMRAAGLTADQSLLDAFVELVSKPKAKRATLSRTPQEEKTHGKTREVRGGVDSRGPGAAGRGSTGKLRRGPAR